MDIIVHILMTSFLKIWGSTIVSALNLTPFSTVNLCHASLKVLCFDLLTRPKIPFKVMHWKEVTHSNGSYERKSRRAEIS